MAEIPLRRHLVPHQLLEFLYLGEAPMRGARPKQLAVDPDLEHAARVVGDKVTEPSSSAKVESNSWPIQAALSSQLQSRQ